MRLNIGLVLLLFGLVSCAEDAPVLERDLRNVSELDIEHGRYLASVGNCVSCHTSKEGPALGGGVSFAVTGGLFDSPIGHIYSSNISPDSETGIGAWTLGEFARALREGVSRDGRHLYPVFPYTHFSSLTDRDIFALFVFLRRSEPVRYEPPKNELPFPLNVRSMLALWKFFDGSGEPFEYDEWKSEAWNRGAYLVRGLAHCNACHGTRNALGATADDSFNGAVMPSGWYAPSLRASREAGVREWSGNEVVALLKDGVTARASVVGPMAEVVFRGTQYLSDADAQAMAVYLHSLKERPVSTVPARATIGEDLRSLGGKVYERHCADCHGKQGEGVAGAFPALAGNRAVTHTQPNNAIRIVLGGGYLPATAGNPRPHGMPPYGHLLKDAEIATVLSYIRNAWGNTAPAVSAFEVQKQRGDAGR